MSVSINVDLRIEGLIEGDEKERWKLYKIFTKKIKLLCEEFNLTVGEGKNFSEAME